MLRIRYACCLQGMLAAAGHRGQAARLCRCCLALATLLLTRLRGCCGASSSAQCLGRWLLAAGRESNGLVARSQRCRPRRGARRADPAATGLGPPTLALPPTGSLRAPPCAAALRILNPVGIARVAQFKICGM